jgi:hypothetical protein
MNINTVRYARRYFSKCRAESDRMFRSDPVHMNIHCHHGIFPKSLDIVNVNFVGIVGMKELIRIRFTNVSSRVGVIQFPCFRRSWKEHARRWNFGFRLSHWRWQLQDMTKRKTGVDWGTFRTRCYTERRGLVVNTPAWYSGGPGCKSRPRLSWLRIFLVFLSPSRRMQG